MPAAWVLCSQQCMLEAPRRLWQHGLCGRVDEIETVSKIAKRIIANRDLTDLTGEISRFYRNLYGHGFPINACSESDS